jgi:hypothetical protein
VTSSQYLSATAHTTHGNGSSAGDDASTGGTAFEAIADYTAADGTQVSLSTGDVVTLVAKSNADWWSVRHGGAEGFAPASYLKPTTSKVAPPPPPPATGGGYSGSESFGVSMAPIDFSGGGTSQRTTLARSASTNRPTAPRMPGGVAPTAPRAPGGDSGGAADPALAFISPTERRRKEEEEMRKMMRRKDGGEGGGSTNRPESQSAIQLLEETAANNDKLKRQLQMAENALESTSAACSELNRQIARLTKTRTLDQCTAEFERLVALVAALKREAAGGVRLADLASFTP